MADAFHRHQRFATVTPRRLWPALPRGPLAQWSERGRFDGESWEAEVRRKHLNAWLVPANEQTQLVSKQQAAQGDKAAERERLLRLRLSTALYSGFYHIAGAEDTATPASIRTATYLSLLPRLALVARLRLALVALSLPSLDVFALRPPLVARRHRRHRGGGHITHGARDVGRAPSQRRRGGGHALCHGRRR